MINASGPRIEKNPYFTSSPFEPTLPPVTTLEEIDLTSPELYLHGDPHAAWRLLRQKAPVFFHDKTGASAYANEPFWALTSYEGAYKVMRDAETFSNLEGGAFDLDQAALGLAGTLGLYEGEAHRQYRQTVAGYTSRSMLETAAGRLREVVRKGVGQFARSEQKDGASLALSLNPELLCAFYQISGDEAARIHRLHFWDDWGPQGFANRIDFENETYEQILADRKIRPRDDIFTALLKDEESGRINRDQLMKYLFNITEAGFLGVRSAIYNPIAALLHHPDQFALLQQHPEYIEDGRAVEEQLRWVGFSMHLTRRVVVDTEILGQPIKTGEVVVAFQTSGNRDEKVFEQPFVLDYSRRRAPILSFGVGPHQCLGQFFTRVVIKSVFHELIANFESMESAGPLVRERPPSVVFSNISSLPMTTTARTESPVTHA